VDDLDIILVEGRDSAESLAWLYVALGAAHSSLLQMALYHLLVVHLKPRVRHAARQVRVHGHVCLQSVATASFDTQGLVSTPTNVGHPHARRVLSRHHSCARVRTNLLLVFQSDDTRTHSI